MRWMGQNLMNLHLASAFSVMRDSRAVSCTGMSSFSVESREVMTERRASTSLPMLSARLEVDRGEGSIH